MQRRFMCDSLVVWKYLASVCRILGTLPYTFNSSGEIVKSQLWRLYSGIFLVVTAIACIYTTAPFYKMIRDSNAPKLSRFNSLATFCLATGHFSCVILHAILKIHSRFPALLNKEPWRYWQLGLIKLPYKVLCSIMIYWILFLTYAGYLISTTPNQTKIRAFFGALFCFLNGMIVFSTEMQFNCGALVLKQQFLRLNNELKRRIKPRVALRNVLSFESTGRAFFKTSGQTLGYDTGRSIADLRAYHYHLTTISENFNSLFSFVVLCVTANTFAQVIENVHVLLIFPNSNHGSIVMVINFLAKMAFMICCCHGTVTESAKTAIYVHRIINGGASCDDLDELRLFSQQLTHLEHLFSKSGYFKIDFDLLERFVSLVSTYIITLMQLSLSLKSNA